MPAQEHIHEVLFTALRAIWNADSNKLGGGTVTLGAREFVRAQDSQDNLPVPYVVCAIEDERVDAGGPYADCRATLVVHTQANLAHAEQNALAGEIQRLYHDIDISSTGTDWKFTKTFVGPCRQLPPLGDLIRFAVTIRTLGYRVDGTNIAPLVGSQGTLTWTAGSGGAPIPSVLIEVVGFRASAETFNVKPPGATWDKWETFGRGGSMLIRTKAGAGTSQGPFIPDGVLASVVLYKNKADLTKGKWEFSARVTRMDYQQQRGPLGGEQSATYEVRIWGTVTETK